MQLNCSIVVPIFNGGDILRATIHRVLEQQTIHTYEIIAIDSGSTDGSCEFLKQQPVRLVEIPNSEFGHARTRNMAVRLSAAEIIVFLSQDATPADESWLDKLLGPFEDAMVGAVFGRQIARADANIAERFFLQERYPEGRVTRRLEVGHHPTRLTLEDIFFSNVNSACRRELLIRHPLDESLIMCEDQYLAKQVLSEGFSTVYCGDAGVWHSHNAPLVNVFKRYFDYGAALCHIVGGGLGGSFAERIKYLRREASAAFREKAFSGLLFVCGFELCRNLGFLVGWRVRHLPYWVRTRCSSHRGFWEREGQPRGETESS